MKNILYGSPCQSGGAKCKWIFTLIAVIFLCNFSQAAVQGYPYVTFDESTGTMTLAYGVKPDDGVYVSSQFLNQATVTAYFGSSLVSDASKINKVIIAQSFHDFEPDALRRMFQDCSNLTDIEGLENINTTNVKNVIGMFWGCSKLKSISFGDNFTTSKVTTMSFMFKECESLEELDLSTFSSEALETMDDMFYGCKSLTKIIFGDNFTIENVTTLQECFYGCESLSTLDLSKFSPTTKFTSM